MKFSKKIWFLSLLFGILTLGSFSLANEWSNSVDLLEQAFSPSIYNDTIVWGDSIWTTKRSVGKYVLKEGTEINIWGSDSWIRKRPSLIISMTKFLLRMTMVLAVSMIIYNGVMYVIKASKGENPKDVLNTILYIGVGILLALFSVIIIRLASSIGTSSLNDISYQISQFIC